MSRQQDLRRIEDAIVRIQRISLGREAARRRSERAGVSVGRPAVSILGELHRNGPQRLSDLSRHTGLEAPLVSREVRALVADGLVTRVADPGDGRAAIVAMTEQGETTYVKYRKAVDDIIAETFRGWGMSELDQLASSLERVARDFASFS
jgi:DNA-binding MarR family transcriptional regulator